jgi:hypothetical protein
MKTFRYLSLLAIFAIFLIAGLNIGRLYRSKANKLEPTTHSLSPVLELRVKSRANALQVERVPTQAPPLPQVTPEMGVANATIAVEPLIQNNILLIGVDNLEASSPRLEGVWLVLYLAQKPQFTLMPIYPVPAEDGKIRSQDAALAKTFRSDQAAFFSQLEDRGIWWAGYYIFDRHALASIADRIVDLAQDEGKISGRSIARVPSAWTDPQGARREQARIVDALCSTAAHLSVDDIGELDDLFLLFSQHISSDIPREQAAAELVGMLAGDNPITCEFPSLVENGSLP